MPSILHKNLTPISLLHLSSPTTLSRPIWRSLKLTPVSRNDIHSKLVTSGLHTISELSCWMNERHAPIRELPFSLFRVLSTMKSSFAIRKVWRNLTHHHHLTQQQSIYSRVSVDTLIPDRQILVKWQLSETMTSWRRFRAFSTQYARRILQSHFLGRFLWRFHCRETWERHRGGHHLISSQQSIYSRICCPLDPVDSILGEMTPPWDDDSWPVSIFL